MSRRARTRAAAVAAKHIALVPMGDEPDGSEHYWDDRDEPLDEPQCHYCHGDGADPMTDYALPCPVCGGKE